MEFPNQTIRNCFNTSGDNTTYKDHVIPAYGCEIHGDGWSSVLTGSFSNGVAVFNFPGPNGFNYDRRYDIIVVPSYRATDINTIVFPTPLAIYANGNFYFDGRIQLAGDDVLTTTDEEKPFARAGGFPGPNAIRIQAFSETGRLLFPITGLYIPHHQALIAALIMVLLLPSRFMFQQPLPKPYLSGQPVTRLIRRRRRRRR